MDGGDFVNATAQFLAANWSAIRPHILKAVNAGFYQHRESGFAEDVLGDLAVYLIAKDKLASHITDGKGVKLSVLTAWARQRAFTRLRGWGTDANTRTVYGARTNWDRQKGTGQETPGTEEELFSVEYEDLSPEESAMFRDTLSRIHQLAGSINPYVLYLQAEGSSRAEISAKLGWTIWQVDENLSQTREVLQPVLSKQV